MIQDDKTVLQAEGSVDSSETLYPHVVGLDHGPAAVEESAALPLATVEYHEIESLINEAFNSASTSGHDFGNRLDHDTDFDDDDSFDLGSSEDAANDLGDSDGETTQEQHRVHLDDEFGPPEAVLTENHLPGETVEPLPSSDPAPSAAPGLEPAPFTTIPPAFEPARDTKTPDPLQNLDHMPHAQQGQPHRIVPEQQVRVGMLQGLSMLGGAGLAGLTHMLHSGGSAINTRVQQRQYGKLAADINGITSNMDMLVGKLNQNGLARGMEDLKGADRERFLAEFLESPGNKSLLNELVESVGSLATKASNAAVVGAGAGLSPDELDVQITKRINDIQEKHKAVLDALKDHNGASLSERLNNLAASISAVIDKLFQRAGQALGLGPRPGM